MVAHRIYCPGMQLQPLLLTILLAALPAWASKVSIDLKDDKFESMPAADLVYQGKRLDEIDVLELKKKRIDISTLNPYESYLWKNQALTSENYTELDLPKQDDILIYDSIKTSPTEFFRAYVKSKKSPDKRYLIVASLDNHTNIIRAALLRNLGYHIITPKYLPKTTIEFSSKEEMEKFIEALGEQTLTKRDKWIVEKRDTIVTFRGLIIEPAKLDNVNIYLPVMSRERQRERRVFRALLAINTLTDYVQDINKVGWTTGREFNNALIFNHPYAAEFNDATLEDLQWIQRRLMQLSSTQIWKAVELAGYPDDVAKLAYQKLLSRINYFNQLLKVKSVTHFKVNPNITFKNVVKGKLTKGDYPNHVVEFYNENPLSPYRFSEIFRLFGTQIVYSALSGGLDTAIEKFVPGLRMNDAIEDIKGQVDNYRLENPNTQGALPLKAWYSPIANGRVFGNRRIVFGQFLNSTAPIQLVDSIGAEINLGMYSSVTGIPRQVMPTIGANANLSRNYIHVRAMPDLKTASKAKIQKILIPRLMKVLGHVLKNHIQCEIPEKVWIETTTLDGNPINYVKYDEKDPTAKDAAIKKRQELIDSGTPASQILLVKADREKICTEQIVEIRNKNMEEFLKQFAENETFIINDSLRLGITGSASIPLVQFGAPANASITLGGDASTLLLRGVLIKRTADGFEVTIQQQKDISGSLDQGLNFYIELFKNSNKWTKGHLVSRVFKIVVDGAAEEAKKTAITTLRHLFVYNNRAPLFKNYKPLLLDHRISSQINTFRALFYKTEKQTLNHVVDITLPKKENDPKDLIRTRKLYSSALFRREGNDYYTFTDRVLNSFVTFANLGSNDGDPGKSFLGESVKRAYTTECELTKDYPMNIMSRVETVYSGWSNALPKLFYKFDTIEAYFYPYTHKDTIDKTVFHGVNKLMSYDIRNTILLYPKAISRILNGLIKTTESNAIKQLKTLYGAEKWKNYCDHALRFFGNDGPQEYFGDRDYDCIPPSLQKILNLRREGLPKYRREYNEYVNAIVAELFEYYNRDELIYWIGEKNFFATTRITGFRTNHVTGYLEYISDSVGKYDIKMGTGLFDSIANVLGISNYELRAMQYTPGM